MESHSATAARPGRAGALDRKLMQAGSSEACVRVDLLGGFEYRRGDEAVLLTLGAQRLVAFLALHRRPLQRVHVAGTLWIDSTEEHANASLRTALWRVQHLRPAVVSRTSTHLALADDVPVDTSEIEALAQCVLAGGSLDPEGVARLSSAKVLLPDWYDDWVVIERERLRQLCLHALEQLSADARAQGRYAQATEAGLGAVALEPLRESAHRAVIETYLARTTLARHFTTTGCSSGCWTPSSGCGPHPGCASSSATRWSGDASRGNAGSAAARGPHRRHGHSGLARA